MQKNIDIIFWIIPVPSPKNFIYIINVELLCKIQYENAIKLIYKNVRIM